MFVSHETYTPARGGSAAAEIHALREVFGADADRDRDRQHQGLHRPPDGRRDRGRGRGQGARDRASCRRCRTSRRSIPTSATLNLSHGGAYPVRYALRLAAGFGSQISMTLLRWTPVADGRRRSPEELGFDYRIADPAALDGVARAGSAASDDPELEVGAAPPAGGRPRAGGRAAGAAEPP